MAFAGSGDRAEKADAALGPSSHDGVPGLSASPALTRSGRVVRPLAAASLVLLLGGDPDDLMHVGEPCRAFVMGFEG